jgi:cell division protein ZapA
MNTNREKNTIRVEIDGMDYSLKSDNDPEYVESIANYVNQKIQKLNQKTNVKSQTKIAVLAALNIADEYFQIQKNYENTLKKLEALEAKSKELSDQVDYDLNRVLELKISE